MTYEQDNQFERLGRYLDGEDVELTPADRELLDEFTRNEAEISSQLDVELPDGAIQRARRRMNAALLARPQSTWAFKLVGAAGMAAALILGIGLFWGTFNGSEKSKPEKSTGTPQVSQDDSDIDASLILEVVQEQLALQEEEEILVLLEPLYAEDTVELWDENDEIKNYLDFNGT